METIVGARRRHVRALAQARPWIARVGPADLARPTPCAGWDLGALVAHVIGQHHGFAAAVRAGQAPREAYAARPAPPGAVLDRWQTSADDLTAALATAPPGRAVLLAEISSDVRFPLETVVAFQTLDTVVHTWDVARSLGEDARPDEDLVASTLALARTIPVGQARTRPGAAFAAPVQVGANPDDGSDGGSDDGWLTALALLGRS